MGRPLQCEFWSLWYHDVESKTRCTSEGTGEEWDLVVINMVLRYTTPWDLVFSPSYCNTTLVVELDLHYRTYIVRVMLKSREHSIY